MDHGKIINQNLVHRERVMIIGNRKYLGKCTAYQFNVPIKLSSTTHWFKNYHCRFCTRAMKYDNRDFRKSRWYLDYKEKYWLINISSLKGYWPHVEMIHVNNHILICWHFMIQVSHWKYVVLCLHIGQFIYT